MGFSINSFLLIPSKLSLEIERAQQNRLLKFYLFRGTRYTLAYEICAQN